MISKDENKKCLPVGQTGLNAEHKRLFILIVICLVLLLLWVVITILTW